MSLERFILEVLREFDIIHKKELTNKKGLVEVDLDKRKIYVGKNTPGYGKDLALLYGCVEVYYRYYNRWPEATQETKLELAKKWYSEINKDLEMLTDEEK